MSSPGGQGPVTLATIAAHLGVSRSTVSNAYNHPDQLSPSLRERILTTATELGYTGPDPVARRLRQRHAGAIGVLFSESLQKAFADPASTLFLGGVAKGGEDADSGMLLIPARPSEQSASVVTNAIVDGFILYSIPPGHPFVEAALRRRLPVVCVDQTRIENVSWVGIDDRLAAREAARHLLDLGHRRIAVIVYGLGPTEVLQPEGSYPAEQADFASVSWLRIEGYGDAFAGAGLAWSDVIVHEVARNTEKEGVAAAQALLGGSNAPTAVICTSDLVALGFMRGAMEMGVDVPGDVSVVGFNDLPAAKRRGLTTVRQPLEEKGEQAFKLLLQPQDEHQRVDLKAELIVRESTAPPKP